METARRDYLDLFLKILGPVITVAGILIGVHQFNVGEADKSRFDHDSKLWLERLNNYRNVAGLAGQIIADQKDKAKLQSDIQAFSTAYWGTMILVEDPKVERAMKDMYVELDNLQTGFSSDQRLKVRAYSLVKACRQSLDEGAPRV